MTETNSYVYCFSCKKNTKTYKCNVCSNNFCIDCLTKHDQILTNRMNEIENDHIQFRQKLDSKKNHSLLQDIDQWEKDSIHRIQETAEQCRKLVNNYTEKSLIKIENQLNTLTKELKQIVQESEIFDADFNKFKGKLETLKNKLNQSQNITIEQKFTSFINEIFVVVPFEQSNYFQIDSIDLFEIYLDMKWKQLGLIVNGNNGKGNQLNQLNSPCGMCIDHVQTIYIADVKNDRIVEWRCNAINGRIVAGGNGNGDRLNQLNSPTDVIIDKITNSLIISDHGNRRVMRWPLLNDTIGQILISDIDCSGLAMDKKGFLYVSDYKNNEVKCWKIGENQGTVVAGGNGKGDKLNQLNNPSFIFVDENSSLYISDSENHRIMKWTLGEKEGIIVAGGNGKGNSVRQLSSPYGLIVDTFGQIYVADFGNDRVMRWNQEAKEGIIILGGSGEREKLNRFNGPKGLAFNRQGNIYIVDWGNDRIQKFEIDFD